MTKNRLQDLLDIIDLDWVVDNCDEAYDLIEALIKENRHMRDYIEVLHEKMLLAAAVINPGDKPEL